LGYWGTISEKRRGIRVRKGQSTAGANVSGKGVKREEMSELGREEPFFILQRGVI